MENLKSIQQIAAEIAETEADLQEDRSPMLSICMNLSSNFNKSAVLRANNSFLADRVIYVGSDFDHNSPRVENRNDLGSVIVDLHEQGYTVYAVDNIAEKNPKSIYNVSFPVKSAFVYGNENDGLSSDEIELCDDMIFIPMVGAARSLNVAQAASIIMAEYGRQEYTGTLQGDNS